MFCGSKDLRTIIFSKNFFFLIFSFFLLLLLLLNFFCFSSLGASYTNFRFLENFFLTIKIDSLFFYFCFIVLFVTCLVFIFSEIYMEHYSNIIFNSYTCLFFFCILILCGCGSPLMLMLGWEYLGISSIFLVIYYSNKTTFFNTILTIYFNRLGDVILILSMSIFFNFSFLLSFFYNFLDWFLVLLLVTCRFTKRAQFPFSRWLPAAISAPTPISAIVHSSTLVTAGVLVILNIQSGISSLNFVLVISFLNLLRFFCGGLIANIELDLKKLVAFSTLSQVRLIYFFAILLIKDFCFSHIFFHALFKSSLFCFCGVRFILFFSNQNYLKIEINKSNFLIFRFLASLFSITGLIFSRSFLSKDLALELLFSDYYFYYFILIFIGGCFTVLYSCKIFTRIIRKGINFSFLIKNFISLFFIFFSLFMLFIPYNSKIFNLSSVWMVNWVDLLFLNSFLLSLLAFSIFFCKNFFFYLCLDIFFMKFFLFKIINGIFKKTSVFFFKDDFFYFNWAKNKILCSLMNVNYVSVFSLFIFLSLIC